MFIGNVTLINISTVHTNLFHIMFYIKMFAYLKFVDERNEVIAKTINM